MGDRVAPVALGLISDPPTIVLSYDKILNDKFGLQKRKRRKRRMPLRNFTDKSNVKRYSFNLRQRHQQYLSEIIDVTLEKLLRIIQEIQKGKSIDEALTIVEKEYSIDPDEDLNLLPPGQLAQRKAVMEETFQKNLLRPGDPGYVYDREVAFDNSTRDTNEWDDEDEKSFLVPAPEGAKPEEKQSQETVIKEKCSDVNENLSISLPGPKSESEKNSDAPQSREKDKVKTMEDNIISTVNDDGQQDVGVVEMFGLKNSSSNVITEQEENENSPVDNIKNENISQENLKNEEILSLENEAVSLNIEIDEYVISENLKSESRKEKQKSEELPKGETDDGIICNEKVEQESAINGSKKDDPKVLLPEELGIKEKVDEADKSLRNEVKVQKDDTISEPLNWDKDDSTRTSDLDEILESIEGGNVNEEDEDFWT